MFPSGVADLVDDVQLPDIWTENDWPDVTYLSGEVLSPEDFELLTKLLFKFNDRACDPAFLEVLAQCDSTTLANYGWALHITPTEYDFPNFWMVWAPRWTANDDVVSRIVKRAWETPRKSILGTICEILIQLDSECAAWHLMQMAHHWPSWNVTKPSDYFERVAKDRGLTLAELEKDLTYDLGLQEGRVKLSEETSAIIGNDLSIQIQSAEDRELTESERSRLARFEFEWSVLLKRAERFEAEMITQQRWDRADFIAQFAGGSATNRLACSVLWAVYDKKQTLQTTFRLLPDGTFSDGDDEDLTLPDGVIGICHPAEISDQELQQWSDVFLDYLIAQPFAQLDRHVVRDAELDQLLAECLASDCSVHQLHALTDRGWIENASEKHGNRGFIPSLDLTLGAKNYIRLEVGPGYYSYHLRDDAPPMQRITNIRAHRVKSVKKASQLPPMAQSELGLALTIISENA